MDDFAIQLSTTDTKKKISVGQDIIDYLGQPDNPADCEDLGAFIDALVPWMTSSNFKVSWFNPDWITSLCMQQFCHYFWLLWMNVSVGVKMGIFF